MFGSRRDKSKFFPSQWHERHHVVSSKSNGSLPKNKRSYFDGLQSVRWKSGEFNDILVSSPDIAGVKGHEESIRKRAVQFPQFFYGRPRIEMKEAAWINEDATLNERGMASVSTCAVERGLSTYINQVLRKQAKFDGGESMQRYLSFSDSPQRSEFSEPTLQQDLNQSQTPDFQHMVHTPSDKSESSPMSSPIRTTSPRRNAGAIAEGKKEEKQLWSSAQKQLAIQAETEAYQHFVGWCQTSKRMHLVAVWRLLDSDKDMVLNRTEFKSGLKSLGYPSNLLDDLWTSLDRDHSGTLAFTEFAPENALDLARFKHWAIETFNSVTNMFNALDTDHNGRVTFEEFSGACEMKGLPSRLRESIRTLYLLVDDPNDLSSRGSITAEEMSFLDKWQQPVYLREKADLAGRMLFQNALVNCYGGNALAAWRRELDRDSSMRVNFSEFSSACNQLARFGMVEASPDKGVPAMYCAFDKDRSGWFSLKDWDESAYAALSKFTSWVKEKHGKMSVFFRSLEEAPGVGVDLPGLRRGMKDSGLDSEATVLIFDGLLGGKKTTRLPGRRLSLEEAAHPELVFRKASTDGASRKRLLVQDVLFLDRWNPDKDTLVHASWNRKALNRMGTWLKEGRGSLTSNDSSKTDEPD